MCEPIPRAGGPAVAPQHHLTGGSAECVRTPFCDHTLDDRRRKRWWFGQRGMTTTAESAPTPKDWAGEWGRTASGSSGWIGSVVSPPSRSLLEMTGADTVALLHGIVTADVSVWQHATTDEGSGQAANATTAATAARTKGDADSIPPCSIFTFFLNPQVSKPPALACTTPPITHTQNTLSTSAYLLSCHCGMCGARGTR